MNESQIPTSTEKSESTVSALCIHKCLHYHFDLILADQLQSCAQVPMCILVRLCASPILILSWPDVIFIENIVMTVSGHCVKDLSKSKKTKAPSLAESSVFAFSENFDIV